MSELPRIDSKKSLEAWLETRPPEDAAIIAYRVAMRVAPVWWSSMSTEWAADDKLAALPILQLNLVSGVARIYPGSEFDGATSAVGSRALVAVSTVERPPFASRAAGASLAARMALVAASRPPAAVRTMADAVESAVMIISIASTPKTVAWPSIQRDVEGILQGINLLTLPLWSDKNPLAREWRASQPILRDTPGGEFWIDWYQRALDGRPQNWPLLRDVALIDDALWMEGGDALDGAIRRIPAKYRLDEVIQDNPYAWRVVVDRKSGLVVAAAIEPRDNSDIVDFVRKAIRDAHYRGKKFGLENFGEIVQHAFAPPIALLKRDLKKFANSPLSLYKAVEAARKEMMQIAEKEGLANESYISRFFDALAEAAEDICAQSPEIIAQLKRREAFRYELASVESRLAMTRQVAGLHLDSEGMLRRVALDAIRIVNDPLASESEKKEAWYFATAVLPRAARAVITVSDDIDIERVIQENSNSFGDRAKYWADLVASLDKGKDALQENVPAIFSWVPWVVDTVTKNLPLS